MIHKIPYGGKPCEKCNGEAIVIIHTGMGGFSITSGYEHKEDCASLFCPHGNKWIHDCLHCDAEESQAAFYEQQLEEENK